MIQVHTTFSNREMHTELRGPVWRTVTRLGVGPNRNSWLMSAP